MELKVVKMGYKAEIKGSSRFWYYVLPCVSGNICMQLLYAVAEQIG